MTIFSLKLIALITMLIDHSAYLNLYQNVEIYTLIRAIGRISFPLYIFIITESLFYTRNIKKFLTELFILAIFSQVPFSLYFGKKMSELNILFTLFFGCFIVYNINILIKRQKAMKDSEISLDLISFKNSFTLIVLNISMIIPFLIDMDYGFIGVYSVVILYYFKKISNNKNIVSALFLYSLMFVLYKDVNYIFVNIGAISSLLVFFYNKKEGKKFKKLFQISYPLHLIIFYLIKIFL